MARQVILVSLLLAVYPMLQLMSLVDPTVLSPLLIPPFCTIMSGVGQTAQKILKIRFKHHAHLYIFPFHYAAIFIKVGRRSRVPFCFVFCLLCFILFFFSHQLCHRITLSFFLSDLSQIRYGDRS